MAQKLDVVQDVVDADSTPALDFALTLYQEFSKLDKPVTEAPEQLGFQRNNVLIQLPVLNVRTLRLLDVLYFFVADQSSHQDKYSIDKMLLLWLMDYSSRNVSYLESVIRQAQQAALMLEADHASHTDGVQWGSVPLLGAVVLSGSSLTFELSAALQRILQRPANTHFLSLRYVFKHLAARLLYLRLLPYVEKGTTPWIPLQTIRDWLDANSKTYDAFKHLNSKLLSPAMRDICKVVGLEVEMSVRRENRSVALIQFTMPSKAPHKGPNQAFQVLRDTYNLLRNDFGLSHVNFREILDSRDVYTDERIKEAIEYTHYNLHRITGSVSSYFMTALRGGFVVGRLDKARLGARPRVSSGQSKPTSIGTLIPSYGASQAQQALVMDYPKPAEPAQLSDDEMVDLLQRVPAESLAETWHMYRTSLAARTLASQYARKGKSWAKSLAKLDFEAGWAVAELRQDFCRYLAIQAEKKIQQQLNRAKPLGG